MCNPLLLQMYGGYAPELTWGVREEDWIFVNFMPDTAYYGMIPGCPQYGSVLLWIEFRHTHRLLMYADSRETMILYTVKWHGHSWSVSGAMTFKTGTDTKKISPHLGSGAQWTEHVRWDVGPSGLWTNSRAIWDPNRRGSHETTRTRKPGEIWIGRRGKTSSLEVLTFNKRLWYPFSIIEALISSSSTPRRGRSLQPAAQMEPSQSTSNNLQPCRGPLDVVYDSMLAKEEKSPGGGKGPESNATAVPYNRWMGFRSRKAIVESHGYVLGSQVKMDPVRICSKAVDVDGCAKHGTRSVIELLNGTEDDSVQQDEKNEDKAHFTP